MATSGKKRETPPERFDLSNPRVVYALLFHTMERVIDASEMVLQDRYTTKDATDCVFAFVENLVGIFLGEDPAYIPVKGWNGPALGRSLRCTLAVPLMELSDEDRELFNDDQAVVIFAINTFVTEVQDFIGQLAEHDLEVTEEDARRYHELCLKWTKRFMPPGTMFSHM